MSRRASLLAEAADWEAAHEGWDADLPSDVHPDVNYYTRPADDGRRAVDTRRAVREPAGLPALPVSPPSRVRAAVRYIPWEAVAPAPDADAEVDAVEEPSRREARTPALLARMTGRQREIAALLVAGKSISEIADDLGLTDRQIRNIVRGNPRRPASGSVVDVLATIAAEAPVILEPVKTRKKRSAGEAAAQQQWAWDLVSGGAA